MSSIASSNILQRGGTFTATTETESITGTYLGIETAHGVWSILLRTGTGTRSVPRGRIIDLVAVAG